MQKKKIIIGNWKMNPESGKLAEALYKNIIKTKISSKVDVVICPPSLYLEKLKKILKKIPLGVQNISHKDKGAFTGEVSGNMVYDLGARYVILGHSERRAMGEEDEVIRWPPPTEIILFQYYVLVKKIVMIIMIILM